MPDATTPPQVATGRETAGNTLVMSPEAAAAYDTGRAHERQRWHDAIQRLTGGHRIGWTHNADLTALLDGDADG